MPLPKKYAKMPKDARAKKLKSIVKKKLAAAESRLVSKLKKLATAKYPANADLLGFELQLAGTSEFGPVAWCVSNEGEQLGCAWDEESETTWKPPVALYEPIMKPVKVSTPAVLKAAKIKDDEWDYYNIIELECLLFTRACWIKADGKKCKVRAVTQEHDSGFTLDLKSGKWEKM